MCRDIFLYDSAAGICGAVIIDITESFRDLC